MKRFLLLTILALLPAAVRAQFEIRGGTTNLLDSRRAGASATIAGGSVNAITVRAGGGTYTVAPAVTIAPPPSGVTATATATINGSGVVSAITITQAGSGYTSPPAVTIAPPRTPAGAPVTTPQSAGVAATSATAGPISTAGLLNGRFPRARDVTNPGNPVVTAVLEGAGFGHSFASGTPLYYMGDEIQRPLVRRGGTLLPHDYWRAQPVQPGETFSPQGTSNLGPLSDPPYARDSVTVTSSTAGGKTVTVSGVLPASLMSGAVLLGAPIATVNGNTVTLLSGANETISAASERPLTPYQPYYYSPHANKVFATQPGRVTITWVSAVPDTSNSINEGSAPTYKFHREVFSVSSGSKVPVRTIFWTEKGFDSGAVSIPAGRIVRANPVFNTFLPSTVLNEYVPVGANPGIGLAAENRTVWYENELGPPSLRAYNLEGRLFVEYLGAEKPGSSGVHQFIGADIVDVRRVAEVATVQTILGEELKPRAGPAQSGDEQLVPSLLFNPVVSEKNPYGSHQRPDGVFRYFAERESLDPDKVTIYWLEPSDAGIHFLPAPEAPRLSIQWPKLKRNYTFVWPESIAAFQPVNVMSTGSGVASALQFAATSLPQVVYQDDPAESETEVNPEVQRLVVDFSASRDKTNRSLLKFTSAEGPWYERLFIQSQDLLGSPEVPDPDGSGPGNGIPAVYTLNDRNADGIADFSPAGSTVTTAVVGSRLEPPGPGYELGGYVSSGRCYSGAAYIDPFVSGVSAAGAGGIIPVNALPTDKSLVVWWFKKVVPPTDKFKAFHVPAIAARYMVSYPDNPQELVIASGRGVENPGLTAEQAAGSIYVQNDVSAVGFNPNEEHALMITGNAYALRDDLNNAATTSQPFVLIAYADADKRPAMRALRVVRENQTYPLSYNKAAGTPLQPPMPLTVLPLPIKADGTVRNSEVAATDNAVGAGAPPGYNSFTFEDRKGQHWLYRGPHNGGNPSFGMKFYYYSREGFFVPGLAPQPPVGTIMPFIATAVPNADKVSGDAVTITYRPKWPDDPVFGAQAATVGVLNTAETLTLAKLGLPQVRGQSSAQVLYQQSIANSGASAPSVFLQDPTRAKTFAFGGSGRLQSLPSSVATTDYAGRTYFQGLPPHLQNRFYFDPNLGTKGGLVLIGEFIDEVAGDDYLNLNALTAADMVDLNNVCPASDTANRPNWEAAVNGLATELETYREHLTATATLNVARAATAVPVMRERIATLQGLEQVYHEVASVAVTDSGLGYTAAPVVTFSPATSTILGLSAIRATGTATIGSGGVTGIGVGAFGTYDSLLPPSITVAPPPNVGTVLSVTVNSGGTGYTEVPTVTISSPGSGGVQATATAVLTSGVVTAINIVNPGSRYHEVTPTITISPPSRPFAVRSVQAIPARSISVINDPDIPVDSYALSSTGSGTGYVTLVFGNGAVFTDEADPVSMQIIKVSPTLYRGDLKVLLSSNPLDEQVTLRHSGDYGGRPENFEFAWRYAFPNNGVPPAVPVADTDPAWFTPNGTQGPGMSSIKVGGSPSAAISTPAVIMADTYFTMKYRRGSSGAWSDWMPPKLVEGWIKRVLGKITPFNQRMTDLYNNAVNTDVSLIAQAGTRWEGNLALNLENINNAGLIEIYETVLNRGKSFTIGSGIDFSASNDALLLAAGYLNDLYVILGNEAYADGVNPTISVDDQTTVTEVNTSRFSFEGQVASALDEELAMLRGRDNFASPGTGIAPAYNRLFWNYTRGINSGEALYAVNYNIREKAGSSTADGILDAADAQRMFPQGHGDAYGHYLTAITGYYKLLTHPDFTWLPRAETVTVLGQPVLVDYQDERKFAAAAALLARTSQQIAALTHRQVYRDDPAQGWGHLRDTAARPGSSPPDKRDWGLDEWTSRSAQGSFFHWVTGNALLVAEDTVNTGVQKIDRTTVLELDELPGAAENLQATMDNANAHLNPLGLSPGAIAFDISPARMQAGESHYEQIYGRALRSVLNARGSFDQAARMTRLLRNQENQLADQHTAIEDQEGAFDGQLTEIYGRPYAGDIGPGKTYPQGYVGPDLINWNVIDRPTDLVDPTAPVTVSLRVPVGSVEFGSLSVADIRGKYAGTLPGTTTVQKSFTVTPNQIAQYATVRDPSGGLGSRPRTGALQDALLESQMALNAIQEANQQLQVLQGRFKREGELLASLIESHKETLLRQSNASYNIASTQAAAAVLASLGIGLQWAGEAARDAAEAAQEAVPTSLIAGVAAGGDLTAPARSGIKFAGFGVTSGFVVAGLSAGAAAGLLEATVTGLGMELEGALMKIGFDQDELQAAYELELLMQDLLAQHHVFNNLIAAKQTADQKIRNLIADGQSALLDRESFRRRAAAVVAGYRTRDLTFRTFRNEALEQYRTLFDLSSRYTYLAAKSYDYETGLLGTPQGKAFISGIVASRSLGDLSGDVPQATTSVLGDGGLAGSLARMNADFAVAEGRLGINNPDPNGTLFSIRQELYRIPTSAATTADDDAWQQSLELAIRPNLLSDPDVTRYCSNIRKPDGSPVPGFIIPYSSTIQHAKNYFGLPYSAGDHNFSPSSYSTKISSAGIVLPGYVGMDPFAGGSPVAGGPAANDPNALGATPYLYLIPCGEDYMLAPPLGNTNTVRAWTVHDQALPLPYNLGASSFNSSSFFTASGTLSEQPWVLRKHQAFRAVNDPAFFYSSVPAEFTNTRLIGRSVWNGQWKIVIPAYSLLSNEQEAMNRFVRSVKDIQIFLRTYSYSGN